MEPTNEELQAQVDDLQNQLRDRDAAFAPVKERLDAATARADEAEAQAKAMSDALAQATPEVKRLLQENNPHIPPDMITGDTPAELLQSALHAHDVVKRTEEHLEARAGELQVPAGAPGRLPVDTSGMTPLQKIVAGLRITTPTGNQAPMPKP